MESDQTPLLARHHEQPTGFDSAVERFRAALDQIERGDGPLTQRVLRAYTKFRPVKEDQLPAELRTEFLTLWETFQRAGQLSGSADDRMQQTILTQPAELAERITVLAEELQKRQRESTPTPPAITE